MTVMSFFFFFNAKYEQLKQEYMNRKSEGRALTEKCEKNIIEKLRFVYPCYGKKDKFSYLLDF
jgi:hypothetical protein